MSFDRILYEHRRLFVMASVNLDDLAYGYPLPENHRSGGGGRGCTLKIVTKNEPLEVPALLTIVDENNVTEAATLWRKISEAPVLRKDEFLPMTHPARFHLYRSEKGVEKTIVTKEPAMPIVITQKRKHVIYEWKIQDDRGIHNSLLSDINEFTLQSPNGRLVFYDPITRQNNLNIVAITLMGRTRAMRDVDDFKQTVTYAGMMLGKGAFIYVTFERFPSPPAAAAETDLSDLPPLKRVKKSPSKFESSGGDGKEEEEEEEEVAESEEAESVDSEDSQEEQKELHEVLRPRTLATITVVAPLNR